MNAYTTEELIIEPPLDFPRTRAEGTFQPYIDAGCVMRGYKYTPLTTSQKALVYFHGSGASSPLTEGPLLDALIAAGWTVFTTNSFGNGISPRRPFRYGYGNVGDPEFTLNWIKAAWGVHAMLSGIGMYGTSSEFSSLVLLGHSAGGSALLGYLAGYAKYRVAEQLGNKFKGVLVNGATIGGLGNGSWNDVMRNINHMSCMMRLAQDSPGRKIINYNKNDLFAPPEYVKRVQMALDGNDPNTFITTVAGEGHSWVNKNPALAEIAVEWCNQLAEGRPIMNLDGSIAQSVY